MTGLCAPNTPPDDRLIGRIVEHEGIKKFVYKDIMQYSTVGIGRCIEPNVGKGLSVDECFYLLRNDLADFRRELSVYDWFKIQDDVRQGVLIELAFNMGTANLLKFKKMIAALSVKNYSLAAKELVNSTWFTQVGKGRSDDIRWRLDNGRYK